MDVNEHQRNVLTKGDEWWTIETAAKHAGITRATVEKYIRQGLPVYFRELGGLIKRDEFLQEWRGRRLKQLATRRLPRDSA